MSANMERIARAQALAEKNNMFSMMGEKRVLEINPDHALIKKIENETDNNELINFMYESALLSGGYQVNDINSYLQSVYKFIN
jgi:HSP90 family molecular chaperone